MYASRNGQRGTALDVFKNTDERRMEQQLKVDYSRLIEEVVAKLAPHNHSLAGHLCKHGWATRCPSDESLRFHCSPHMLQMRSRRFSVANLLRQVPCPFFAVHSASENTVSGYTRDTSSMTWVQLKI